jgi:hypothetical protein
MPTTPIDALYLHAAVRPDATAFIHENVACNLGVLGHAYGVLATGMGL